jgi:hypothetical protein
VVAVSLPYAQLHNNNILHNSIKYNVIVNRTQPLCYPQEESSPVCDENGSRRNFASRAHDQADAVDAQRPLLVQREVGLQVPLYSETVKGNGSEKTESSGFGLYASFSF